MTATDRAQSLDLARDPELGALLIAPLNSPHPVKARRNASSTSPSAGGSVISMPSGPCTMPATSPLRATTVVARTRTRSGWSDGRVGGMADPPGSGPCPQGEWP